MSTEEPAEARETTIDWDDAREANRLNWDDRAALHEQSYGIEAYVDDPSRVSGQVRGDLAALAPFLPDGSVEGLRLAHLQCHIGTDAISWARCGAHVTGLDLSGESLAVARRLAEAGGNVDVEWVQSDVLSARDALDGDFDVVYTSIGALCWVGDLDAWARQIASLLRPGGVFYVQDGHPMMYALEEHGAEPRVRYRYFPTGQAQAWDDPGTYSGGGRVSHARTYEFPHSLAEVLGSLLHAGLSIEHFDEGQVLPWRFNDAMVETPDGWVWPTPDRIPCTFTVVARRPRQPPDMATTVQITFDCADPMTLRRFWCTALGYEMEPPPEPFSSWQEALAAWGVGPEMMNTRDACVDPEGRGPRLFFEKVPEGKSAKNRVHLDLRAAPGLEGDERMAALQARADELVEAGASILRRHEPGPLSGGFIVMADPEGNEFCLD